MSIVSASVQLKPTVLKTLFDPSDAELEQAFATDIAHWEMSPGQLMEERLWMASNAYRRPPNGLGQGVAHYRPKYCSSFDLVLPSLEAWRDAGNALWICARTLPEGTKAWGIETVDNRCNDRMVSSGEPLPKLCVIALLRAHGWTVEFSKK